MNDHLKFDQAGLDLTVAAEGMRLKAYQCPAGVWTIGVGHTGKDVYPGRVITTEEGYQLLRDDIRTAEEVVHRLVDVELTQGQFNALVDFTFNCGATAFANSTLLKKVNARLWADASREFSKWTLAGGKILPGLIRRREAERTMFLGYP